MEPKNQTPSPQKHAPYSITTLFKRLRISQTILLLLPHPCLLSRPMNLFYLEVIQPNLFQFLLPASYARRLVYLRFERHEVGGRLPAQQ